MHGSTLAEASDEIIPGCSSAKSQIHRFLVIKRQECGLLGDTKEPMLACEGFLRANT